MSYTFKTSGFFPSLFEQNGSKAAGCASFGGPEAQKRNCKSPTCNNNDNNFLASQRELSLTGRGHRPEFAAALAAGSNSSRQIDAAHLFK